MLIKLPSGIFLTLGDNLSIIPCDSPSTDVVIVRFGEVMPAETIIGPDAAALIAALDRLAVTQDDGVVRELAQLCQDTLNLIDYDIIDGAPNGNGAFGVDEGVVKGREVLHEHADKLRAAIARAGGAA